MNTVIHTHSVSKGRCFADEQSFTFCVKINLHANDALDVSFPITIIHHWFALEIVPQRADELGDGDSIGVVSDEAQDEDAVLLEILVDELAALLLVAAALAQLLHQVQVLLHVAVTVVLEDAAQRPRQQREAGDGGDEDHPEPDEQVDLLVEEVDGQHALHGVALHVAKTTHLEVAHGDAREALRFRPVFAAGQGPQHVDAVGAELMAKERVQNEELRQYVTDVDELAEEVECHQVVAASSPAHDAAGA